MKNIFSQDLKNYSIIFFLVVFICISCKNEKNNKLNIAEQVDYWIGREIIFPDSLMLLNGRDLTPLNDSLYYDVKNYKIVTYIYGDCHSCVEEINKWEEILSFQNEYNFEVIFFIFTLELDFFLNNYYKDVFLKHSYIIDTTDKFEINNRLIGYKEFQTFLLDSNNIIKSIGNPIYNEKVWKLYREVIENQL